MRVYILHMYTNWFGICDVLYGIDSVVDNEKIKEIPR